MKPTNYQPDYSTTAGSGITLGSGAGGDLSGSYPAPTVAGIGGIPVNVSGTTNGYVLTYVTANGDLELKPPGSSGDTSGQFIVGFDNADFPIGAGKQQDIIAPFTGTITGWTMLADVVGSAIVDVWKDLYANFPPTVADTITGSAKPTLSAASKATSTTLTGWTTAVTAGDVLRFNLDSASAIHRLLLVIAYSRP